MGGNFNPTVGKDLPGTYANVMSERNDTTGGSEKGTVVIPLINHNYGPEKEYIMLTSASPDACYDKLGYSIYDDNEQMLLIREAFKNANTVYIYIPKAGNKAVGTGGGITATARYGGSRGNDITFSSKANPTGGFDVEVFIDGNLKSEYIGLKEVDELSKVNDMFIEFSGTGLISAAAGVTLQNGTDGSATNADLTNFLDTLENISFNTLAFPVNGENQDTLKAACKAKIVYLREEAGKGVNAVIPEYSADYEGVINVTNAVIIGNKTLTIAETCAWVAGVSAAADYWESNTYKVYEGATGIFGKKTYEEERAAVKNGEFFFAFSETNKVIVRYDINSLVTFKKPKDKTYRKNRVLRTIDSVLEAISVNFPPNKYDNNDDGWDAMEGIGKSLLNLFSAKGTQGITDVDYDRDFLVDRVKSSGDETYINLNIKPVDSAEKLFFTVKTR